MTEPKDRPAQPDKPADEKEPELNRDTLRDLAPGEAGDDVRGGGGGVPTKQLDT